MNIIRGTDIDQKQLEFSSSQLYIRVKFTLGVTVNSQFKSITTSESATMSFTRF